MTMTGRQKMDAALSPGGSEQVPVMICYENVFLRDHWPRLTRSPWWHLHAHNVADQIVWMRDVVAAVGQDTLQMFPWTGLQDEENTFVETGPAGAFRMHRITGHREPLEPPNPGGYTDEASAADHRESPPETPEAIEAAVPLPGSDAAVRAGRNRVAEAIIREFGDRLWPYRIISAPLWRTYHLWGFEGMMLMIATRPELVRHACERFLAMELANIREAAEHGAAGIWVEDCLTDMISPKAFVELNVPYLRRLIEAIRDAGMKSIYYYTGNPAGKWDIIMSLGMDALGMEESKKGFRTEIEEIVDRVAGRCAVLGNLDAFGILQDGGETDLRAAIQRQLDAGRATRGRFIMSLGSPVTPATPISRVRQYGHLVRELSGTS
jgi:hypothetical protein